MPSHPIAQVITFDRRRRSGIARLETTERVFFRLDDHCEVSGTGKQLSFGRQKPTPRLPKTGESIVVKRMESYPQTGIPWGYAPKPEPKLTWQQSLAKSDVLEQIGSTVHVLRGRQAYFGRLTSATLDARNKLRLTLKPFYPGTTEVDPQQKPVTVTIGIGFSTFEWGDNYYWRIFCYKEFEITMYQRTRTSTPTSKMAKTTPRRRSASPNRRRRERSSGSDRRNS